jgi:SAM-dependent methyltransferase
VTSKPFNQYGDRFKPTDDGHGVDIASQRQDELDAASLDYIRRTTEAGRRVTALDLGGGYGTHSVRMAEAGAVVTMVDVEDMASGAFASAIVEKSVPSDALRFLQRDFCCLADHEIPKDIDVLYSQRAIHYVPYRRAETLLRRISNRMARGGMVYISAAGFDTEYGQTYPDRDKPVEARFNFVTPDMREKHAIFHKIATYTEEDMASLLRAVGFSIIRITRSAFGNIKTIAMKPS